MIGYYPDIGKLEIKLLKNTLWNTDIWPWHDILNKSTKQKTSIWNINIELFGYDKLSNAIPVQNLNYLKNIHIEELKVILNTISFFWPWQW